MPTTPAARSSGARERAVLVGLALALAAVVVLPDAGVLTPDTKPEIFLAPWRTMLRSASPWQDSPFLGAPSFNVGLAPVAAVLAGLDGLGVPPWLSMRTWRLALLLLAAAGARRLAAEAGGSGPAGRTGAAVLYAANPYLLLGGATTPTLLPYALLPWLLVVLRRALLRPRSLVLPCVAALVVTAMSGINAGVAPALQAVAVVAVVAEARWRSAVRWRNVARVLLVTGVLALLLAAYWLVPALSALSVGTAIAGTTESLDVIAATSSPAEVLRGLGLWTLYGVDRTGPFTPGLVTLLTSPAVVVASFAGPVLAAAGALLSRSRGRLLGVLLLAVAVPVCVGTYPGIAGPTPFGRALGWAFEHVPGAVAFRTTNKAGSIVVLGLALLGALAVEEGWQRLAPSAFLRSGRPSVGPGPRLLAVTAAGTVLALGLGPLWTGGQYLTRLQVPDYWRTAADDLDRRPDRPAGSRVLFVPGTTLARYRWGYTGPDELGNALFERPTAYRSAVPAGTAYAAGLLAGTDLPLQEGTLPAGAMSALARYLGAGDVLVRNDTVWEAAGGAAPWELQTELSADPGLSQVKDYGDPGRNTVGPGGAAEDATVPPLRAWAVDDARSPVRQVGAAGSLLVDGDGAALPGVAGAGLLGPDPVLLLAGSLDADGVRRALRLGTRIVLTDTDARRVVNPQALASGHGPLLAADEPATPSLALFGSDDQTVLTASGDVRVGAEGRGLLFGPFPYGAPSAATDGDASTSWLTGNFGTGAGQALVLRALGPRAVPSVRLVLPGGSGARATRASIEVSGDGPVVRRDVALPAPPQRAVDVDLGTARGREVRIRITGVSDDGAGPVGFAEVSVPGWDASTASRLPVRLVRILGDVAAGGGQDAAALARTPLDVQLVRRTGPSGSGEDEEAGLSRDLTLPDARVFTVTGRVRLAASVPDDALDRLAPRRLSARVVASSRLAGRPDARASSAVDFDSGDRGVDATAWVPDDPAVGQWIELQGARRALTALTIRQPGDAPGYAVRARVEVDGVNVSDVALAPGTVSVPLGGRSGSRVRVTLLGRAGEGPVRFSDVRVSGVGSWVVPRAARDRSGCFTAGSVDGAALRVRPVGSRPLTRLFGGGTVAVTGCDGPLALAAGPHRIRPLGAFVPDRLVLTDARPGPGSAPASRTLPATVQAVGETERRLRTVATHGEPYYVVAGTGYDSRWRAVADGVDLGPPVLVDGYSSGWFVADGAAHDVRIRYGPARRAAVAAAVSATVLAGCVAVVGAALVRRRRRRHRATG